MSFGTPHLTLPEFEYVKPTSLQEVLDLVEKHRGDAKLLAGGVGLLAFMKERLVEPKLVVDIKSVPELRKIEYSERDGLTIGAAVSFNEILDHPTVMSKYKALHQAISSLSDVVLRNRSTLLGNLCEALPFVDSPAPLIVFDAQVHVMSSSAQRVVPVEEFVKGIAETALNENEVAVAVELPNLPDGAVTGFAKHLGDGSEFSVVSVAALVAHNRSPSKRVVRLAYGGIGATPVRAKDAEKIFATDAPVPQLIKKAVAWTSESISPMDDNLASGEYRRHLIEVLTYRLLSRLFGGEDG